jgi:hypothetical protein
MIIVQVVLGIAEDRSLKLLLSKEQKGHRSAWKQEEDGRTKSAEDGTRRRVLHMRRKKKKTRSLSDDSFCIARFDLAFRRWPIQSKNNFVA